MTDRELAGCADCGMPCTVGEYHPFAACLMFKACRNSAVVRANLAAVVEHGGRTPSSEGDGRDGEDARAWRQWCEAVGAEQVVALNEKFGDALGLVKDAERYRWLRSHQREVVFTDATGVPTWGYDDSAEALDAALDAAIASAAGGGRV